LSLDLNQNFLQIEDQIFNVRAEQFQEIALNLFHLQYQTNWVYKKYCDLIQCNVKAVKDIYSIPFLPISCFKNHVVKSTEFDAEIIFESSGTTTSTSSKHYIKSNALYLKNAVQQFESFYGSISDYCILALLPSYLERSNSSLIAMVDHFMQKSNHPSNGFYLNNLQELSLQLKRLQLTSEKVLLIGVSFALLDFAERFTLEKNDNLIVMETGGMKGRRKEIVREDLHNQLKASLQTESIHSEYGMTELLSQAYSKGHGKFEFPEQMRILIGKQEDPFAYCKTGEVGKVKIIDLANIYSCAFIETDDLGKTQADGSFEILGRSDISELRGCNLMLT